MSELTEAQRAFLSTVVSTAAEFCSLLGEEFRPSEWDLSLSNDRDHLEASAEFGDSWARLGWSTLGEDESGWAGHMFASWKCLDSTNYRGDCDAGQLMADELEQRAEEYEKSAAIMRALAKLERQAAGVPDWRAAIGTKPGLFDTFETLADAAAALEKSK